MIDPTQWLCEPCHQGISSPLCVLCETDGRHVSIPVKVDDSGQGIVWAHVFCAVWTPEVSVVLPYAIGDEDEGEASRSLAYCFCGEANDGRRSMIGCGRCGAWQHIACINLSDEEAAKVCESFFCENCVQEAFKSLKP